MPDVQGHGPGEGQVTHKIPDDVTNDAVEYCIDQYVRLIRNRELLRDHWFHGLSFKELADKYHITETAVKKILYGIGDSVILRASNLN